MCRSPSWKPAEERWEYQNDAERAEQILKIFIGAHADKMPLCSSFQYGGLQSLPIDTLLRKRSTESVPSVPSVWEYCAKLTCIR